MKKNVLCILSPVFEDWESFELNLVKIDEIASSMPEMEVRVLAVNDGSPTLHRLSVESLQHVRHVSILHLVRNVGHQRAIAIGLAHLETVSKWDYVLIMDADGEDRPEEIPRLVARCRAEDNRTLVFASRRKRTEKIGFRLGYFGYKRLFAMLSGVKIEFGHFCLIPGRLLRTLVSVSEIWNHFPAGVIKSRIPFVTEPCDRGNRLRGQSRMNLQSLVLHGLSAISVFNDNIGVRALFYLGGRIPRGGLPCFRLFVQPL